WAGMGERLCKRLAQEGIAFKQHRLRSTCARRLHEARYPDSWLWRFSVGAPRRGCGGSMAMPDGISGKFPLRSSSVIRRPWSGSSVGLADYRVDVASTQLVITVDGVVQAQGPVTVLTPHVDAERLPRGSKLVIDIARTSQRIR